MRLVDFLDAALHGQGRDADGPARARVASEAARLGVAQQFLDRGVNVEFSGGEQKRAETLQLAVLEPQFAVLDEIDSGLDVDALRDVARRVEAMTTEDDLGVLAITHYARLLDELRPDVVHVLMAGRIVADGGPELADSSSRRPATRASPPSSAWRRRRRDRARPAIRSPTPRFLNSTAPGSSGDDDGGAERQRRQASITSLTTRTQPCDTLLADVPGLLVPWIAI